MKNVNIMGGSMKNLIFRGGSQKPIYKGEMPEKREGGLDSLQIEGGGGGLEKKMEVVFLRGVDTPMHTMLVPSSYLL